MRAGAMSRRDLVRSGFSLGVVGWAGRGLPSRGQNAADLDAILLELLAKHRIPGAIVGVY